MGSATIPEQFLYSSLADDPDLAEIVEMFVQEMPDRVSAMEARFDAQQWLELERAAHQIKGAAGSYGFNQLTPAAARLEAMLKQKRSEEDVREALGELTSMCRRVRGGTPA